MVQADSATPGRPGRAHLAGASLRGWREGWRGASPTRGTAGAAVSSGPRPPGCFHILIKVPPPGWQGALLTAGLVRAAGRAV